MKPRIIIALLTLLFTVGGAHGAPSKLAIFSPDIYLSKNPKVHVTRFPATSYVLKNLSSDSYRVLLVDLVPGKHGKVNRKFETFNYNLKAAGHWIDPEDGRRLGSVGMGRATIYQVGNRHNGFQFTEPSRMFRILINSPWVEKNDQVPDSQIFESDNIGSEKNAWVVKANGLHMQAGTILFDKALEKKSDGDLFLIAINSGSFLQLGSETIRVSKDTIYKIEKQSEFKLLPAQDKSSGQFIWVKVSAKI